MILENHWGRVEIRPQGAQVLSYIPRGGRELLWVSPSAQWGPGEPVRGGIPLCVPWFADRFPGKPAHGFGRNQTWTHGQPETLATGATRVTFRLEDSAETRALWPGSFRWEHEVTLGPSLNLEFRAWNLGSAPVELEMVWHTYFAVDDVSEVRVSGLEGWGFLDKNRDRAPGVNQGPLKIAGPTDLLFAHAGATQVLGEGSRRVDVSSDAPGAVVWNAWTSDRNVSDLGPGTHRNYLCVERGALDGSAVTLAPGNPWALRLTLTAKSPE